MTVIGLNDRGSDKSAAGCARAWCIARIDAVTVTTASVGVPARRRETFSDAHSVTKVVVMAKCRARKNQGCAKQT